MSNFLRALPIILQSEGGYVNHPADPGGATNQGVTQRVYDAWRSNGGQQKRSVREITPEEVEAIYREQYWDQAKCDKMPWPLSLMHFDAAVNHGVTRANKLLQKALGVTADGVIGNVTLAAIRQNPPKATDVQ